MKKKGIELIAAERQRQIDVEGWTLEHDQQHDSNELLFAAEVYLMNPFMAPESVEKLWPFDRKWLKLTPKDRVRELTKAGAIIAAEIDRIQNS